MIRIRVTKNILEACCPGDSSPWRPCLWAAVLCNVVPLPVAVIIPSQASWFLFFEVNETKTVYCVIKKPENTEHRKC